MFSGYRDILELTNTDEISPVPCTFKFEVENPDQNYGTR